MCIGISYTEMSERNQTEYDEKQCNVDDEILWKTKCNNI